MDDLDGLVSKVIGLAERAGEMMLRTAPVISEYKGTKENYATDTDLEIQRFLQKELPALLPGSSFMGEEENSYSKGECVWIVDPIDGTVNYARGLSMSVVSIALVENGKAVLGVVYNPYMREMYRAELGKGAYMNGSRIRVSDREWNDAIVSTAWCAYDKNLAHSSFIISERLHSECSDIRRFGTAAYEMCLVARGSTEIYFEMLLRPWDYAAASLIVEEAGGVCSSLNGPLDLFDQDMAFASNSRENLDRIRDIVRDTVGTDLDLGSIWK